MNTYPVRWPVIGLGGLTDCSCCATHWPQYEMDHRGHRYVWMLRVASAEDIAPMTQAPVRPYFPLIPFRYPDRFLSLLPSPKLSGAFHEAGSPGNADPRTTSRKEYRADVCLFERVPGKALQKPKQYSFVLVFTDKLRGNQRLCYMAPMVSVMTNA